MPVSVLLPAFTTVGMPLVTSLPFLGTALLGWFLLRNSDDGAVAVAGWGSVRRPARAATGGTGAARRTGAGAHTEDPAKEKELLEALGRRGELAVAGAALETSLTVDEADRVLSALTAKGHLEVRVERGRLLYSLWEGDAPL